VNDNGYNVIDSFDVNKERSWTKESNSLSIYE